MELSSWKSLLAGKGQLVGQRLHSGHVASKDTQQMGESTCTNVWYPEVHTGAMYTIIIKKINYPKLVKQIYFVIDNFHVTAVSHSFTPSPPSDISVFSLINWSQEGPYGSVWWKKTKMKQASQA